MAVHIPSGTQLIISGPAVVEITPQTAPYPVPTPTPMQVPNPVPTPAPTAAPPMHPGMTVTGFQPTYESWGGYSPVPQYHGQSPRPAPLFPTYETMEGFAPVAPDQHKGMGPLGTKDDSAKKIAYYEAQAREQMMQEVRDQNAAHAAALAAAAEPVMTKEQVEAAKAALAAKKPGPERELAQAHLEVEAAKVKAKELREDGEADGNTIVQRLYNALGLNFDDGEGAMDGAMSNETIRS